jgi:hypothetical protein
MSSTFADNVGNDKVVVFSGSNIQLTAKGCPAPGPCPFDVVLTFTTPFRYSGFGSLLLDFAETDLSGTGSYDAHSFTGPPGGSVAQVSALAGTPPGQFEYKGNVVQLIYTLLTTNNPAITGVVNVASNIPPGFPNYGIAQGALFAIYGNNLGPANLSVANLPCPPTAYQVPPRRSP